ncbi:MAG TPA: hypothetical protein VFT45_12720 [Longimicrobium sp.]|nr:hypothetical protein [Longimicrobium sp.]
MKKLKLQMEDLAVESFTTDGTSPIRGTVEGHNTFRGNTCGAENTCGPQTCPPLYCSFGTDPVACDTGNCPTPACPPGTGTGCPSGTGLSCVGCTTQDYTVNLGDDTCGFCMSFGSDVPARCPCP